MITSFTEGKHCLDSTGCRMLHTDAQVAEVRQGAVSPKHTQASERPAQEALKVISFQVGPAVTTEYSGVA